MSLAEEFTAAQSKVRQLKQTPSNDDLLALYSLYKQATLGDAQGKRPGMLDFRGRAKFDAWATRKGMGRDAAIQAYVDLVTTLAQRLG